MAAAFEGIENFLLRDFLSWNTLKKNYEMDKKQMTTDALDKRHEGYQKICLYGLGSVFWGAATGVLSNIKEKYPAWIFWGSIYFVVSLVLMLNGLTASSFSSSTPLALATAGLGAWTAYIYMLATFHVASLSFHNSAEECVYSMLISSIVITIHWTYSSQDPLVFLVFGKLIVWLVLIVPYGVVKLLLLVPSGVVKLLRLVTSGVAKLISTLHGLIIKDGNPLKCSMLGKKSAHNTSYISIAIDPGKAAKFDSTKRDRVHCVRVSCVFVPGHDLAGSAVCVVSPASSNRDSPIMAKDRLSELERLVQ